MNSKATMMAAIMVALLSVRNLTQPCKGAQSRHCICNSS